MPKMSPATLIGTMDDQGSRLREHARCLSLALWLDSLTSENAELQASLRETFWLQCLMASEQHECNGNDVGDLQEDDARRKNGVQGNG